jgi:hypothetical protein
VPSEYELLIGRFISLSPNLSPIKVRLRVMETLCFGSSEASILVGAVRGRSRRVEPIETSDAGT